MDSKTPQTDIAIYQDQRGDDCVDAAFARDMERQNDRLIGALKIARKWIHAAYDRPPLSPEIKEMVALIDCVSGGEK